MYQLIHNGIIVPEAPRALGLSIVIKDSVLALTPHQEEMAMAWVRKIGTPYVDDPVFQVNFLKDFLPALNISTPVTIAEIDWSQLKKVVNKERYHFTHMSQEKKKELAAERKAQREALKAAYGYAIVDGQRVELGNYMAEPSGLFMGRGQHPLRGRWKQGASQEDITLNLSPDAPRPAGSWKEIVWQPESLWVARWDDKLSGKTKYVWLADTTPAKQTREAAKFDKARRLQAEIDSVRAAIQQGLADPKPRTRMLATACYLIDTLCLRVGDEKDPDEADTVGATTLRPEHIKFMSKGQVEFHFLGKDSVEWKKKIRLPELVRANLEELVQNAHPSTNGSGPARDLPQLFPDIDSTHVNRYLSSLLPGLSAKVFRTYRATSAVQEALDESGIKQTSPEYSKWQAVAEANLQAAELCNHTKKAGVNWSIVQHAYQERLDKALTRQHKLEAELAETRQEQQALREQIKVLNAETEGPADAKHLRLVKTRSERNKAKLGSLSERVAKASLAVGKIKAQMTVAKQKRAWNLSTSLKSYIDPRIYYQWGEQVGYDVLSRYYPTVLQRKFAWVRLAGSQTRRSLNSQLVVRTCLLADLPQVTRLFSAVKEAFPKSSLPLDAESMAGMLPALGKSWREAIIALDASNQTLGFAVLGPERSAGKLAYLDVFGVVSPGEGSQEVSEYLAEELLHRFRTFQAHNPKGDYELQPQDSTWFNLAPDLADALGLLPDDEPNDETVIELPEEA